MTEQLRSAGDQLCAAWDNYCHTISTLRDFGRYRNSLQACDPDPSFSKQLNAELAFISSHISKAQQLKVDLSQIYNSSSELVPINTLPPEILTRIFHLTQARDCPFHDLSFDDEITSLQYPTYPNYLAQVCSLWRKTALSSRLLWCHIDLSPGERWFDSLVDQAKTQVARTGDLPIELHIAEEKDWYPRADDTRSSYGDLCDLISSISNRVGSLEIFITGDFGDFYRDLLSSLLCGSRPGLTKLAIRSGGSHRDQFISPEFFEPGYLVPSGTQLESVFHRLTVLHLRGIFPQWSSAAYHGLVDLRLLSASRWSRIEEAELTAILRSSPGLRILHFGLQILNPTPLNRQVTPVHLQDLRVIKIFTFNSTGDDQCPINLLRLLAPGTQPLQLVFNDCYIMASDLVAELDKFFARSRVARFYTPAVTPPISLFLRHAAHLECVVLDDLDLEFCLELDPTLLEADEPIPPGGLKSLYIIKSTLFESELHLLLECCPTGIVLDSCRVYLGTEISGNTRLDKVKLLASFPTVTILEGGRSRQPFRETFDYGRCDLQIF